MAIFAKHPILGHFATEIGYFTMKYKKIVKMIDLHKLKKGMRLVQYDLTFVLGRTVSIKTIVWYLL